MIAGDYLEALRRLPEGTLGDVVGDGSFLVVAPHPDDETLGCGALLATALAQGQAPHVLILTDGSASHPGSRAFPPERLVALRRTEAERATAALGLPPENLHFLNLKDAAAPASGPAFDAAVATIVALAFEARVRGLFVTWRRDPHCDHEAAFAMACAAHAMLPDRRLWAYPIWGLHLAPDTPLDEAAPTGLRLDATAVLARKRAALACYASQMTDLVDDDPGGFRFTEATLAPFIGPFETFIAVRR